MTSFLWIIIIIIIIGKTDIEQLSLIFNCFGTPITTLPDASIHPSSRPANYWPGVETLPNYIEFEERTAEGGFDFSSLFRYFIFILFYYLFFMLFYKF